MPGYFGISPSPELQALIDQSLVLKTADGQPLHTLRKKVNDGVLHGILDNLLGQLVTNLPDNDKKETMAKLVNFLQATVSKLMGTLLDHGSDESVKPSLQFLSQCVFKAADGQSYLGMQLPEALLGQVNTALTLCAEGKGRENIDQVKTSIGLFSDQLIHFFLNEYSKTLNLGMIKRKAVDLASGTINKMIHMSIPKIVDSLGPQELKILGKHYGKLFHVQ